MSDLTSIPDSKRWAVVKDDAQKEDAQIFAMIFARGGSKRCPRKNARTFCGKPLLAWSVIAAKAAHQVTEVYLSTDDSELADIGREYGATVMMREDPRESLDTTSGGLPSHCAIQRLRKMRKVDAVVHIFPNCPLRKPDDYDRLITAWHERGYPREINLYAPKTETFLYRKIDDRLMRTIAVEKATGRFWDLIPGISIDGYPAKYDIPVDWSQAHHGDVQRTEDSLTWPILGEQEYIVGEPWQIYEIDTADEFHLCEYLMYKYVLKDGEDVYERYRTGRL